MQQPIHSIAGRRREMTPERVFGLGFVGLLHVVALWAIVMGLTPIFHGDKPQGPIVIDPLKPEQPPKPREAPPDVPKVDLSRRDFVQVQPPVFKIAPDQPAVTGDPLPPRVLPPKVEGPPDTAAFAVAGTHTTPDYPLLERRLDHQGTVKLRLAISPEGAVTGAEVVQSSGYPSLDQAAVSWVIQHWRYKAATHDGAPVASTAVAAVVFNIKNTG